MVDGSKQAVMELTQTVKKESLADFTTFNHQKSAVNKLSLHNIMLGELVSCLDKAAQNAAAPKRKWRRPKSSARRRRQIAGKGQAQQGAIKDAKDPKAAKALIEKLDLAQ